MNMAQSEAEEQNNIQLHPPAPPQESIWRQEPTGTREVRMAQVADPKGNGGDYGGSHSAWAEVVSRLRCG